MYYYSSIIIYIGILLNCRRFHKLQKLMKSCYQKTFTINQITLPSKFSLKVQNAIERGELGDSTIRQVFVRECVAYFESRLPHPTADEYSNISRTICDTFPCLKDKRTSKYWVCTSRLSVFNTTTHSLSILC